MRGPIENVPSLWPLRFVWMSRWDVCAASAPAQARERAATIKVRIAALPCTGIAIMGAVALTPRQRQFLKGLAHPLSPVVRVGKAGVSATVIAETKRSLEAHELIKVRVETDDSETRQELA